MKFMWRKIAATGVMQEDSVLAFRALELMFLPYRRRMLEAIIDKLAADMYYLRHDNWQKIFLKRPGRYNNEVIPVLLNT